MAVEYTLELFPTAGNWDAVVGYMGGTNIVRTNDNAGVDMYCSATTNLRCLEVKLLDLGVKARMIKKWTKPANYNDHQVWIDVSETCHFWLAPRSSIWKSYVTQANSVGVIDKSYRGPLMGAVLPMRDTTIEKGQRLFQVLAPDMGHISLVVVRPESELDTTVRGEGGFGSSGK